MNQPMLPRGWKWAKLGQLCEIMGGGTPSRRVEKYFVGNVPWATPTDVTALESLEITRTATYITDEAIEQSSTRLLPPGCVLLTSRATIGFTAVNTVPMCTNQGFANFQCGQSLNNYFLAYYLSHIKEMLVTLAGGSIYKEINKTTLRDLRVANVQDGYLDLSEVRTIEVLPQDIERYRLEDGDILMIEGCGNPNYLGRGCIWQDQIPGCIHQNHIFRVRTNRGRLLPEFLASLLRTKYANGYFLACAKNSSGISNINSTQVKAFPVPEPPLVLQQKFVSAVGQWEQIHRRLTDADIE